MNRQTVANIVSLSRIPLGILGAYFVSNRIILLIIIVVAWITDLIDGWISGKKSRFGAIIDPFADKIFILLVGIALLKSLPLYLILIFFSRDIFTAIAFLIVRKLKDVKALFWGKVVTGMQFFILFVTLMEFNPEYFIYLIGIFTILAICEYHVRYSEK